MEIARAFLMISVHTNVNYSRLDSTADCVSRWHRFGTRYNRRGDALGPLGCTLRSGSSQTIETASVAVSITKSKRRILKKERKPYDEQATLMIVGTVEQSADIATGATTTSTTTSSSPAWLPPSQRKKRVRSGRRKLKPKEYVSYYGNKIKEDNQAFGIDANLSERMEMLKLSPGSPAQSTRLRLHGESPAASPAASPDGWHPNGPMRERITASEDITDSDDDDGNDFDYDENITFTPKMINQQIQYLATALSTKSYHRSQSPSEIKTLCRDTRSTQLWNLIFGLTKEDDELTASWLQIAAFRHRNKANAHVRAIADFAYEHGLSNYGLDTLRVVCGITGARTRLRSANECAENAEAAVAERVQRAVDSGELIAVCADDFTFKRRSEIPRTEAVTETFQCSTFLMIKNLKGRAIPLDLRESCVSRAKAVEELNRELRSDHHQPYEMIPDVDKFVEVRPGEARLKFDLYMDSNKKSKQTSQSSQPRSQSEVDSSTNSRYNSQNDGTNC